MKLYPIYKNLFESYDDLITEELLDEVQWQTSKESKLKDGEIPLTPTIVKFILGEHKRVEAFHIMGVDNIDGLRSIVGKRNTISAFKFFEEHNLKSARGIQTKGGIIAKINGYLNIIGATDIMSTVDSSLNRRWISARLLSYNMYDELKEYFRYFEFKKTAAEIQVYLKKIFELLDKYHIEIQGNLFNMLFGKNSGYGWNELLVRNIQVSSIAWLPDVALRDEYHDDEEEYIREVADKLKTLTPNVYTFDDSEDLLKWFKENGGHIDFNEFVKSEFKNYKREDFLKNIQGVVTLFKHDPDYLFKNIEKFRDVIRSVKDNAGYPYTELINVAEEKNMLSLIVKTIFKANGKDWDNVEVIKNLIARVENRDFNKWLIDFYGPNINKSVINKIVTTKFDDDLFHYLISKVGDNEELLVNIIQNAPLMLNQIQNPPEKLLIAAVSGDGDFIKYIDDPSEAVQLAAVQQNGTAIGWIVNKGINPSDAVKYAAVRQSGSAIRSIVNPSEELIMLALKHDGRFIKHINNPSEEIKLAAVKRDGIAIEYIENPSEAVQLAAVQENSTAIGFIKNPTEKVQMLAVTESPRIIEYINNPSEAVQMAALKVSLSAIYRIDNPTKNVLSYYWTERVKEGHEIDNEGYDYISDETKYYYITSVKNRRLTSYQIYSTPDKLAKIYLQQRLDQGWSLNYDEQVRYNKLKGDSNSVNESRRIIKNILRGKS